MLLYFVVFLAAVATDLIPIIGPPVWTVMVFMVIKYGLDPWLVLLAGVPGSVLGRYGLSLYVSALFGKLIKQSKSDEIRFARGSGQCVNLQNDQGDVEHRFG